MDWENCRNDKLSLIMTIAEITRIESEPDGELFQDDFHQQW